MPTVPSAPSTSLLSSFRFQTIGQPPSLLTRLSAPDSHNVQEPGHLLSSPIPSPPLSPRRHLSPSTTSPSLRSLFAALGVPEEYGVDTERPPSPDPNLNSLTSRRSPTSGPFDVHLSPSLPHGQDASCSAPDPDTSSRPPHPPRICRSLTCHTRGLCPHLPMAPILRPAPTAVN